MPILHLDKSDTTIETIDNLIKKLSKPIDICCHYFDYKNFKSMEKLGTVITAGKVFSNDYPKAFYNMISRYSHAVSNQLDRMPLLY